MMTSDYDLSPNPQQIKALSQVGTIGTAHAAIAFSQMLGRRISFAVTRTEVIPSGQLFQFLEKGSRDLRLGNAAAERLMIILSMKLAGDLQGGILLAFERGEAIRICDFLLGKKIFAPRVVTEMDQSLLKEVANILGASYLNTLSQMIDTQIVTSIPRLGYDPLAPLLTDFVADIIGSEKEVITVVTEFIESNCHTRGSLMLLPQQVTMQKILKGLKKSG